MANQPESPSEKLKIAGVWTGTIDVTTNQWTLTTLRDHISLLTNTPSSTFNLISSGRLLKDDPTKDPILSELGLRNNSKILVSRVSVNEGKSIGTELMARELRAARLARLKSAVSALAERHAGDGSFPVEDFNIQLEDQRGQKVNMGSETDQRAIMMGLMLHAKGKELIATQQFKDALEVLEMGEEAFSLCDPTLLERVDNVSILQIDIVWCYFMLRDINLLSVAGERLEKAKKGIELSHGKDGSRVRLLQNSRCPELALYLRLELLEGVAAFHCGNMEKCRRALTSAKDKFSKLQVSDEALSMLMSMGYKQHEATRALKLNEQHVESAVNFLEEEKENKIKKQEDDLKRQKEIREQRRYGKTPLGKAVDMEKLDALVCISFEKELAAEALRRHENDALKALDDLTNPETKSNIQLHVESKKRKRQQGNMEARISELANMGFDRARVTAALNAHGTTSKALDELLATTGVSENLSSDFAAAASSSAVERESLNTSGGESPSTGTDEGDDNPSTSHGVEERDAEIEGELAQTIGSKDAFSDYDIDITKEAEALTEYLTLLDSALDAVKPGSK